MNRQGSLPELVGSPQPALASARRCISNYTSDEGYPDVQLLKNSKVLATSECRTSLSSTQRGGLIHVSAMTPERGLLQYVLGYAKLNDSTWISYLASSADADEVGVLKAIFTSLVVNPIR